MSSVLLVLSRLGIAMIEKGKPNQNLIPSSLMICSSLLMTRASRAGAD